MRIRCDRRLRLSAVPCGVGIVPKSRAGRPSVCGQPMKHHMLCADVSGLAYHVSRIRELLLAQRRWTMFHRRIHGGRGRAEAWPRTSRSVAADEQKLVPPARHPSLITQPSQPHPWWPRTSRSSSLPLITHHPSLIIHPPSLITHHSSLITQPSQPSQPIIFLQIPPSWAEKI